MSTFPEKREPVNMEIKGITPEAAAHDAMDVLFPERALRPAIQAQGLTQVPTAALLAELESRAVISGDPRAAELALNTLATLMKLMG